MRTLPLISLFVGVLALLVGCGGSTPPPPTDSPSSEGQLLFFYTDN